MPLAILFGALFTVAVSTALGALVLGDCCDDWGVRFVTGGAVLSLAIFCLCAVGFVYPLVFLALGMFLRPRFFRTRLPRPHKVYLSIFGLFFVLYFFNAMAPEFSFDGSRYHLGLVGRYLREHGFHRITDNLYASLSQGIEMLFLFAYAFGKHSAAAIVHFAFLVALAWMMFAYGRRTGYPAAGAVGAVLTFVSPLAGVDATSAYNDVAVAAIAFALFYLLELWSEVGGVRLLVAAGCVAGFAYAAKYTAWVAVPYALGFVAWKSRRVRDPAIVAACASLLILPWMAKNWMWVHNPVAPFFNGVFPNPYITVAFEREYRHSLATNGRFPWELGPVFLLAPLGLLALRIKEGRHLLLAAAVFGVSYFSNVSARFLLPSLPFVALAMGLVLSSIPQLAMAVVLLHAVLSWPSVLRRYAAADAWHLVKVPYREALRIKPEDGFLQSNLPDYGVTRTVEQSTAPGSAVFTFRPIPEAYTARRVLVAFQSAENLIRQRTLYTGFVEEYAPVWRLAFSFPRQRLKAIRLLQTGRSANDLWTMHELRVFDGTRELSRDWKLTGTDPWRLGNLVDGDRYSFWVCGDTLRPGQFVQAGFAKVEELDSVRIEASPNQWALRLELDIEDENGSWHRLSGLPQTSSVPPPDDLWRSAEAELKRSGVDYLLMFDGEFGANVARKKALQVAEYRGARLYQLR